MAAADPTPTPPTREDYVACRRQYLEHVREAERLLSEQGRLTHELFAYAGAEELAGWLRDGVEGEDITEHGVRHWDLRWHREQGLDPGGHPNRKRVHPADRV